MQVHENTLLKTTQALKLMCDCITWCVWSMSKSVFIYCLLLWTCPKFNCPKYRYTFNEIFCCYS